MTEAQEAMGWSAPYDGGMVSTGTPLNDDNIILEQFFRKDILMACVSAFYTLDFLPFIPLIFGLLILGGVCWINRSVTKILERINQSFRLRNGHKLTYAYEHLFLVLAGVIVLNFGCIMLFIAMPSNTIVCMLTFYFSIITADVILLSSVYVTSYASAILMSRAESEPHVPRHNPPFYALISHQSFYAFIREGVYLGILLCALTSDIYMLISTLFLIIIATAVYDAAGISSLGRNIDFPYKGLLCLSIGIFAYYFYENKDSYAGYVGSYITCVASAEFLLIINLIRFKLYGYGAKNDLKREDDVIKRVLIK